MRRSHVERRIPALYTRRRDPPVLDVRHLPFGSLFDDDMITAGYREVDGGAWRGHVEWNAVMFREDRNLQSNKETFA